MGLFLQGNLDQSISLIVHYESIKIYYLFLIKLSYIVYIQEFILVFHNNCSVSYSDKIIEGGKWDKNKKEEIKVFICIW